MERSWTLAELCEQAGVTGDAISGSAPFTDLCSDSRRISPTQAYVVEPSPNKDTHQFLSDARTNGAQAAIVHSQAGFEAATSMGFSALLLDEGKGAFSEGIWKLAKTAFGNPSRELKVVGITGTNGKTTTAWILREALIQLGSPCAYLGTLGYQSTGEREKGLNTTPFASDVQRRLRQAVDEGCKAIAMEVSSHALAQKRVDGVEFDFGVMTNFTQDHLDFHVTMEAYKEAKWRLFSDLREASSKEFKGVFNVDDPVAKAWSKVVPNAITYGTVVGDFRLGWHEVRVDGLAMEIEFRGDSYVIDHGLGGAFNLSNTLSAFATLHALGYDLSDAAEALSNVTPVPGRFESVPNEFGFGIIVDYAHTPDALERTLDTIRALGAKRIIGLFGCGGDRDRTKRPIMAAAVGLQSDIVILTSDNPRTEDPMQIISDARAGLNPSLPTYEIPDRREAVVKAIELAEPGDVVLLAGKGHEDYQIVGTTRYPM
ncbi:MAG TPA: UDP-N-acetylmuramoyl-L-alanyl-D-glutamate--2,6-diaminopimelate ligase, partial [Fimbriimonadaceae bacterium]|nr:UDP-N-acetylmuramoyl-L-alanyl-D-glutamate--2,6-diaminopimelate ligase [Fimbriimonadaceae bacterium]